MKRLGIERLLRLRCARALLGVAYLLTKAAGWCVDRAETIGKRKE